MIALFDLLAGLDIDSDNSASERAANLSGASAGLCDWRGRRRRRWRNYRRRRNGDRNARFIGYFYSYLVGFAIYRYTKFLDHSVYRGKWVI